MADESQEATPLTEEARLEKELNRLKLSCAKLSEFFDTVQIFCTKQSDDRSLTEKFEYGHGNGYAIYGQIKNYILATEQAFKMSALSDLESDEDDEKGDL
jgi:hypothetical protein